MVMARQTAAPHLGSGAAAERPWPIMQRIWDKWGLPVAFVVIGCIMAYGIIAGIQNP